MGKQPKILVVGSLVMDTISTTIEMPKPGQTVLGESYTTASGGKGANQAMEACLLGADVTMVGKVGNDTFGDILIQSLKNAGVHTEHILRNANVSSAVGNVILQKQRNGQTQNRIIVLPGANLTITEGDMDFLKNEISEYDMVLLQLEIPMDINELVAEMASEAGVPVMLNPAPFARLPQKLLENITYISPNETEASQLLQMDFLKFDPLNKQAIEEIRNQLQRIHLNHLLLTLGSRGAMIIDQISSIYKPCEKGITAIDPTAAGDSFVGAFCTAKCYGFTDSDSLELANMIAGLTVSKLGAQPSLSTIDDAIVFYSGKDRDLKLLNEFKKLTQ